MSRRKNIKKDETLVDLVEAKESAQGFLEKNQFLVLGSVVGILLIVGGILAYSLLYKAPREKKAASAMYKAEEQFKRDSFALALENPGGGFDGFLDVIDNYNGTKAANLAKYYAGISYLNLGMYDASIEYLNNYSPSGEVLPITKYGALADAHSEKSEFDKAISLYEKAVSAKTNDLLTPYYLNKLGLLQMKQGNAEAAQEAFTRLKEEFPNSSEGQMVDKYLNS